MDPLHPIFKNICAGVLGITEKPKDHSEVYHGYLILEVFRYFDRAGRYLYSDWQVHHGDEETGYIAHKRTIEQVKTSIDEIIEENSND